MSTDDAPTTTTTNPPAAPPAGDAAGLAALQAQIDAARRAGADEARADYLARLQVDDIDTAAATLTAQREAEAAAMTEAERREQAAQEAERAAGERQAAANDLIRTGVIHMALIRAGVAPGNVEAAAPLVQLGDDLGDEAADAAVKAVKDNPAFASLFSATPPTGPASSVTGGTPKPGNKPAPTGDKEKSDALLDYLHPLPKTA